ncbi:MAG: hypothetical protein LBH22_01280 [Bacteroidales bacterium]|jgi:cell division protein FtsW (lipid II flippase)|nr:hypothetical protein [Bacteroidales bacterium]
MEKKYLDLQYKLSIEARDKLNDNFHKWMTFYYVANAAILVAIVTLCKDKSMNTSILVLSILGVFISMLWNLSCKGYNYWSRNWMNIIIKCEKNIQEFYDKFGVYSIFAKEVAENNNSIWSLNNPANISTPKLTMLLSLTSMIIWIIFAICQFWKQYSFHTSIKVTIVVFFIILIGITYGFILPRLAKSRTNSEHKLFNMNKTRTHD